MMLILKTGRITFWRQGSKTVHDFQIGNHEWDGIALSCILDQAGLRIEIEAAPEGLVLGPLVLDLDQSYQDDSRIFVNGFQSWTESREFGLDEKIPPLRSPAPQMMNQSGDYTFFPVTGKKGYFHSHDHTYIRTQNTYQLWRDLLPTTGYTIFEHQTPDSILRIHKDLSGLACQNSMALTHIQVYRGNRDSVFDAAWQEIPPRVAKAPVTGWTSWYYHYTKVDEVIIADNLQAFAERQLPIDMFQIDDGWQPAVGDWLEANAKFPSGMKSLADRIHDQGLTAGLWLAPFIVAQNSSLFQEHPDWFATFDGEHLIKGGFNPGWGGVIKGYYYVLDLYHPAVRTHLKAVFDRILRTWGFDLVKLDFLYAVALYPRAGRSRGAIMHDAMDFLRECCGDKLILGCGVPLGAAQGKVEYCRIGADMGPGWDMKSLALMKLRERISTRNSLRSTLARRHLSRRAFFNDPDVFMLRQEENHLTHNQKHTQFLINLALGDLVFTSDDISRYTPEILTQYQSQFPNRFKRTLSLENDNGYYKIELESKGLEYLIVVNLNRPTKSFTLPPGQYFSSPRGFVNGLSKIILSSYESRVFLKLKGDQQMVLGSDGHLFPGMDVEEVSIQNGKVQMDYHPFSMNRSGAWVRVADPHLNRVGYEGKNIPVKEWQGIRYVHII